MFVNHITQQVRSRMETVFAEHRTCRIAPLSLSSCAFIASQLRRAFERTVVVIADTTRTQDEMLRNLAAFTGAGSSLPLSYPAWDSGPDNDPDVAGERINTLNSLMRPHRYGVLVSTCVKALMQLTITPDAVRNNTFNLVAGEVHDPDTLVPQLDRAGYEFAPEVVQKGQAARRGGLLDVWPPHEPDPFRVEFFGPTVETIRSFDPVDQRSTAPQNSITIPPADERKIMRSNPEAQSPLTTYLKEEIIYLWFDCQPPAEDCDPAVGQDAVLEMIQCNPSANQCIAGSSRQAPERNHFEFDPGFQTLPPFTMARDNPFEPDLLAEQRRLRLDELKEKALNGMDVHFFFNTPGSLERFRETHAESPFHLHSGFVSDGFINNGMRVAVVGESLLMGRQKRLAGRFNTTAGRRPARRHPAGETITDWTSIRPGDLVVHVDHGIGRYAGMREIDVDGRSSEMLAVEYADGAKLYVPVAQSHLLSRYIGAGKSRAALHRLGRARWSREKRAAELAVRDLAASLLQIQAMRESMKSFAFPKDDEWQHEFETAFPYEETADQARAIEQVKADMESSRPMDRLICGDAGYGKTEVALRASFKAVTAGKQVAMLVPTTVLAQQHFEIFTERMGAYPFNIELLCRFRTRAQQEQTVRKLADGTADIVIGTHRLLQRDVIFKDLGLVIIDEEQRFGVAHKEHLKHMRKLVDVLTLTATPIPRTLYMSLTGARDISMIQTAPETRLPIDTIVAPGEDPLIRDAIHNELNRGGQVYYLHNRIATIERVRRRLQDLSPEARIKVAHGRTRTPELSELMREFEQGKFDLLLCTTIIQSGVDIPNVNTILIDRADRFGIADLYQLRGRVGRSGRKAYAYLLLPINSELLDESRRRINALLQHTGLGDGLRLAIRDLEIRGAGNLLGRDQSGHIAAVGFDLYCQLLKRTVSAIAGRTKEGETALPQLIDVEVRLDFIELSSSALNPESSACLPRSYVEDEQMRLAMYRKIASAGDLEDIRALRDEFQDRFGPVPPPLDRLLKMADMRVMAAAKNITSIKSENDKIMLKRSGSYIMPGRRFPRLRSSRPDERIAEIIRMLERLDAK